MQYHAIRDSLHVACQLLSLERLVITKVSINHQYFEIMSDFYKILIFPIFSQYPAAAQLALDMLTRLTLKSATLGIQSLFFFSWLWCVWVLEIDND